MQNIFNSINKFGCSVIKHSGHMAIHNLGKDLQIPDLNGRLAIVTGANSGTGFGITKRLAASGAHVIMAVRNFEKGIKAMHLIQQENNNAKLSIQIVDLSILQSIRDFADRLFQHGEPIHILINNAGLMTSPKRFVSSDGFELHFAANYLGHFALTARLMPLLCASGAARITMMSSSTNHFGEINFEDLQLSKKYSSKKAYAQSKLAMLMFAMELNSQSQKYGWTITSNAAHPGATSTNIQSTRFDFDKDKAKRPFTQSLLMKIPGIWQRIEEGCLPALFAATSPEAIGGGYYGPGGLFELHGFPKLAKVPPRAKNTDHLDRLWRISEDLAKVHFQNVLNPISSFKK